MWSSSRCKTLHMCEMPYGRAVSARLPLIAWNSNENSYRSNHGSNILHMREGDELHARSWDWHRPVADDAVNEPLLAVLCCVWPVDVQWLEDRIWQALGFQVLLNCHVTCRADAWSEFDGDWLPEPSASHCAPLPAVLLGWMETGSWPSCLLVDQGKC